jgi:hypothetical protein
VLCVGGLAVAAYSARTLISLSAPVPAPTAPPSPPSEAPPPTAAPRDAAFGARGGVSMIGPSSLSATLLPCWAAGGFRCA